MSYMYVKIKTYYWNLRSLYIYVWVKGMVLNSTFNNISFISWRSVLLVEETRVSGKTHRPVTSRWQTLSHNVASSTPRLSRIRTHKVSGDKHRLYIGSCKSNPQSYTFIMYICKYVKEIYQLPVSLKQCY